MSRGFSSGAIAAKAVSEGCVDTRRVEIIDSSSVCKKVVLFCRTNNGWGFGDYL